ncbi:MAG: hypothetical protein WC526_00855 [Patescibacteria group bacterium]
MFLVYRAINYDQGEVCFGVSKDPVARRDGAHCVGITKAVRHWDCANDRMRWDIMSQHRTQAMASAIAHGLEREYVHPQGFYVIQTAGV